MGIRGWTRPTLATALALGGVAASAAPSFAVRAPSRGARPDVDIRAADRAPVRARTADARTTLDRRLGPEATVSADRVTGGLRLVARTDGLLTAPSSADPATVALAYVGAHRAAFGLDGADLGQLRLLAGSTSPDGVTHLVWSQTVAGVAAYDSQLSADVTRDGRLVSVGGAPVHDLAPPSTDPPLGPSAAHAAAQRDLGLTPDGAAADIGAGPTRPTTFDDGDHAVLVVVADAGGDRLAWKLTVAGIAPYVYEVVVDAATGAILARHGLTEFASAANVVDLHPGAPGAAGAPHVVDLAPWLPASPTRLNGPNAHAYADTDHNNSADPSEEVSPSANFDFSFTTTPVGTTGCPAALPSPCTWDGTDPTSAAVNQRAVTTQVFYDVNRFHDWLAQSSIAFTSFTFDGGDALDAETNDGGGLNNANMSTPADGQRPRMQMYLFNGGWPSVNGGDDATVVYHEYTHGMSNRLVGNDGLANGLRARQSRAMGEGWSDWYALDYVVQQGVVADDPATPGDVVVGAYVTDLPGTGIRSNALDCPADGGGLTSCPGSAGAGPGGFTFADLGRVAYAGDGQHPYSEVHADGEIWAETLWDLRQAIGGDAARRLITAGMRLSPKQPSFLDMRDAILRADLVVGGTYRAQIWAVFAARGMGYGATTTSANAGRGLASIATPPVAAAGAPTLPASSPLGDGDAIAEPGEPDELRLPLTNPAATPLTNVQATLTTSTPGVAITQATASYGTIAGGATGAADRPFAFTVPASVPCGTILAFTLSVGSDQGTLTAPVSVPMGSGSATAVSTVPVDIPDNDPTSNAGTSTLTVTAPGRVGHLRVTVTARHSYVGDLHGWLISPAGTRVTLFQEIGSAGPSKGAGFAGVVLDDAAAGSIQDVPSGGTGKIAGTYSPSEPLAALADESRAGTWTLRIVDDYLGDVGTLLSWSLSTDEPACVVTGDATAVGATTATLTGAVGADNGAQSAFEYGTTTAYGSRTAADPADGARSASVSGLAGGTTYHVRAVALRGETVVATGADRTFTTANGADAPAAPTPAPAPSPGPAPPRFTPPTPAVQGLPAGGRLDARGALTLSFGASPPGATGAVRISSARAVRIARRRPAVLAVGRATFTVPASGRLRVRVVASPAARAYVRRHGSLHTTVTVRIGGRTFRAGLTLRAANKTR